MFTVSLLTLSLEELHCGNVRPHRADSINPSRTAVENLRRIAVLPIMSPVALLPE